MSNRNSVIKKTKRACHKLKRILYILLVILLLPYIVTHFFYGSDTPKENTEEAYLLGQLAQTMPVNYESEALAAQVVLLRTKYYLNFSERKMKNERMEAEIVSDEELFQILSIGSDSASAEDTYQKNLSKLKKAIKETDQNVLTYQGELALTPYHESSNGSTRVGEEVLRSVDYPYLKSVPCEKDKEADAAMHAYTFTYQEVRHLLHPYLRAVTQEEAVEGEQKALAIEDFAVTQEDSAGYAIEVQVGKSSCGGEEFREVLGLASSAISFSESQNADSDKDTKKDESQDTDSDIDENTDESIVTKTNNTGKLQITTMGNGHGLGMSQWTANEMAKEGKTYAEILVYFFEGTELKDIDRINKRK